MSEETTSDEISTTSTITEEKLGEVNVDLISTELSEEVLDITPLQVEDTKEVINEKENPGV